MTICPHSGVTHPECSCRACLQAQIEQYSPHLAGISPASPPGAPGEGTEPLAALSRPRFFGARGRIIRGRFRRAA